MRAEAECMPIHEHLSTFTTKHEDITNVSMLENWVATDTSAPRHPMSLLPLLPSRPGGFTDNRCGGTDTGHHKQDRST